MGGADACQILEQGGLSGAVWTEQSGYPGAEINCDVRDNLPRSPEEGDVRFVQLHVRQQWLKVVFALFLKDLATPAPSYQ